MPLPQPYATLPVAGRAPLRSGKVRDLYDFGDALLLVASDRISAFDVVFREPVPGKGIVLNTLSDYWFSATRHIISNHRITSRVEDIPLLGAEDRARLRGRAMYCKKAPPLRYEWVVRGYLSGSGWSDYKNDGAICGISLPKGLRESDRLPEPILTPTTKEEAGHDRPVAFDRIENDLGAERARAIRSFALRIYQFAFERARRMGILIADTKFEFGESNGEILLIDEALTPDSSRFWPADAWKPGGPQPSYDKQFVRDYLLTTGWNKTPPPPPLPADILLKTAGKYAEICERLTAHAASASPAPAVAPLRFEGGPDGKLILLDQTKLPAETVELQIARVDELAAAIHRLSVRGAPAIGVAGGYGVVLALREYIQKPDVHKTEILKSFDASVNIIKSARPTAVNLAWGVDRVAAVARAALAAGSVAHALDLALAEARAIEAEDRNCCERIGRIGADLLNLQNGASVLTHCNAGALATTGIGTALGVIYTAAGDGRRIIVYADETRPLLQGSRLTAYELTRAGIEVRVVTDGMAARVMSTNKISAVIVGADRIALNGDTANKIGTQALAIIAKHFGVPFYVAAPLSTFDPTIPDGSKIPIEMRSGEEVTEIGGIRTAPSGTGQFNPAFDVTPAALISAIITEEGAASPPNRETISALLARGNIKIH